MTPPSSLSAVALSFNTTKDEDSTDSHSQDAFKEAPSPSVASLSFTSLKDAEPTDSNSHVGVVEETPSPSATSVSFATLKEADSTDSNSKDDGVKKAHAPPQVAVEAATDVQCSIPPAASIQGALNSSSLLSLPPEKASMTSFPPGCPVLHVDTTASPPVVTMRKVESVSVDLSSFAFSYHVTSNTGGDDAIIAPESQLQWTPSCNVWAYVTSETGPAWKPCIVLTGYQPTPQSVPLFSLQEVGSTGSLFHGIPKEYVCYRHAGSMAPVSEEPSGMAPQGRTNVDGAQSAVRASGRRSVADTQEDSATLEPTDGDKRSSKRAKRSRELDDARSEDSTASSIETTGTNFPLKKRKISDDDQANGSTAYGNEKETPPREAISVKGRPRSSRPLPPAKECDKGVVETTDFIIPDNVFRPDMILGTLKSSVVQSTVHALVFDVLN